MRILSMLIAWCAPSLSFGGGSSAAPPPPPAPLAPPPILQSPQAQAAAEESRRRAQSAHGLGATIMTSAQGAPGAPVLNRKQLLGG